MRIDGLQLSLMIGPVVPLAVPREVLDALDSLQVSSNTQGPSGFRLSFKLSTRSPLHTLFLVSGGASSIPLVRVVIVVTVSGSPTVLIDGVMTHHQIEPGAGTGSAMLTVIGEDLTRVMDYFPFTGLPFPAMPAEARVLLILAKYAPLGVIPKVIPSVLIDIPIPTERIPVQRGKDLGYIRGLAEEVGYVFYMEPGPTPGTSFAYWGPEIKIGAAQKALNVDFDANANVESIHFKYNSQAPKLPLLMIQNALTKIPIPIPVPPITPLNPPLGAVMPIPLEIEEIPATAKYSPIQAALIGLAKASKTADAVTASGSLNVARYGAVLQPRKLVGVRGAGLAFNGLYYVTGVTHEIRRGEYKQSFELARNGLISTVPQV